LVCPEEHPALDSAAGQRSEYINRQIYSMAGGTRRDAGILHCTSTDCRPVPHSGRTLLPAARCARLFREYASPELVIALPSIGAERNTSCICRDIEFSSEA
jgi:hypothetical protein